MVTGKQVLWGTYSRPHLSRQNCTPYYTIKDCLEEQADASTTQCGLQRTRPFSPQCYTNMLSDCKELLANQVADTLAKQGSRMSEANYFVHWTVPPLFVARKLEVGTLFIRLTRPLHRTICTFEFVSNWSLTDRSSEK
ncbi:hypothetical protein H5410_060025 [Solanum commersonii]|uniref:Uncharacterized protein n=1 Tax=Solanum commersonii TaxID=4109 RepID=A0A9J5W3Z4_SOLCO|nr:hypothetical protein H5410_060025 [Solanum commersonii]